MNDEQAIREVVAQWLSATKAGDLETVLSLMSDDALFLTPGAEPFGKKEFAASSEGMKGMAFEGHSDIREIQVFGDWAWMHNHLTIKMGEPAKSLSGHTLTIFKKNAEGKWQLARDANFVQP